MASMKEKPWNGGLIAGVCGILSFIIPAVIGSLEGVLYGVWMWGLYSGSMEGVSVTIYLPDDIGLITSLIILASSIILCITGIKARKLKRRDKTSGIIWTILGAIMLSLQILYLVIRWTIFILPGSFIHLGIYFSIWAGSFALISGIIMTRTSTTVINKMDKKIILEEENPDCPHCKLARSHAFRVCPECGKKLK